MCADDPEKSERKREDLEHEDQAFFKEEGFVTNAFDEVNVNEELKRTAREAKSREDEHEKRHGGGAAYGNDG
jgi:hypothetical protein